MPVEMVAVAFDGTHTAEKELSDLRTARTDPWLEEVAVLEHHKGGRFSMKATSPTTATRTTWVPGSRSAAGPACCSA